MVLPPLTPPPVEARPVDPVVLSDMARQLQAAISRPSSAAAPPPAPPTPAPAAPVRSRPPRRSRSHSPPPRRSAADRPDRRRDGRPGAAFNRSDRGRHGGGNGRARGERQRRAPAPGRTEKKAAPRPSPNRPATRSRSRRSRRSSPGSSDGPSTSATEAPPAAVSPVRGGRAALPSLRRFAKLNDRCPRGRRGPDQSELCDESHRRARGASQVARPRPPGRGAAQHHSDPVERAPARRGFGLAAEGDRPRHRGDGEHRRRRAGSRRDHGSGARALRHRAQAARRRTGLPGDRRRRPDDHPLGPLALRARRPAGGGFPGSRHGRDAARLRDRRRRPEAPDRQDAIRDLDRGDALLPERHIPARARSGRRTGPARGGERTGTASPGSRSPPLRAASECRA